MLAARDGYSKVINLLVSHGAEVNVQDGNGYTVRQDLGFQEHQRDLHNGKNLSETF